MLYQLSHIRALQPMTGAGGKVAEHEHGAKSSPIGRAVPALPRRGGMHVAKCPHAV